MTRKLMSMLLAFALCLTLLPAAALADETGAAAPPAAQQQAGAQDAEEPEAPDADAPEEDEAGSDEAVTAVQTLIDALPDADELDGMDADELDAAYADIQAAYDAYDALTADQQALLEGADCFEALFGWFNGQIAPLADEAAEETVSPDGFDAADGKRIDNPDFSRTGPVYTGSSGDESFSGEYYVVKGSVTIGGNLTIDGSTGGGLMLCDGAALTVEGALIHKGGNAFYIYGQTLETNSEGTGRLIIQNSSGSGAAIRSVGTDSQLPISSGELEIHGNGQKLIENVKVYSENSVHKGILDGDTAALADWSNNPSVSGKTLVLAYCKHEGAWYKPSGDAQHTKHCDDCGFAGTAKDCGTDGVDGYVSGGDAGHYQKCACGNKFGSPVAHEIVTVPVNSTYHISGCRYCDYTSGSQEQHVYEDGVCKLCKFSPVASTEWDDYASVQDAMDTLVKDHVTNGYVKLSSSVLGKIIKEEIVFNYPDQEIELQMNGHTLTNEGGPVITVEAGTLKITGDAVINQTGTSRELVAPAIKVTGGRLIFEDTLHVTGSAHDSAAAPAIEVLGGTVTFEKDVTATAPENAGLNTAIAPAVRVSGGKAVFNGALTATGGLGGVTGNKRPCEPAVYAEGGELEFNGDLDLNGGLTVTKDAKLTKGLSQGTFRVEYYADDEHTKKETVTEDRISVIGSTNYTNINSLLAANRAFYDETWNPPYLGTGYKSWSGDVTIEEHTHTWQKPASGDNYVCSVCGAACAHEGGFETGKCEVCGKPCPHDIADQSPDYKYYCNECHQQMIARIKTGLYDYAHYTNLADAFDAAENGQTITLLGDTTTTNNVEIHNGDNTGKEVTLDLNGHSITGGQEMSVGKCYRPYPASNDYYPGKLNIVGTGSILCPLDVSVKGTLDLSGWTGGTIHFLSVSDLSDQGTPEEREPALIIGTGAGKIEELWFGNNQLDTITRVKLSGGSYDQIGAAVFGKEIRLCELLEEGCAFQYTNKEGFVEYTKALEPEGSNKIYNVKVVKCPHEKVENGKCAYCGTTGIAAVLDGTTVYSDVETAINAWLTSGRKLILHTDSAISGATWNGSGERILDLNGHALTSGHPDLSSSLYLTVQDSSEAGSGKIAYLKVNSGARLTLESGTIESLDVESAAEGAVKLRGGTVTSSVSGGGTVPVYTLLEDGCYLKGSALLAKFSGGPYEVKRANITVGGEKTGEIAIGKNIVNIPVSLTLADAGTTAVKFDWYRAGANRNEIFLLASVEAAVTDGAAAYDPAAAKASLEKGWDSLVKDTDYTLICMATGMAGAEVSWQAALTGYTLHMLPPSIEDAKITFAEGWQEQIFWPDPADNSVGKIEIPSGIDAYVVTLGSSVLEEGTDYKVTGGNLAAGIGTYDLTIEGIAPNYSGTKTAQWTVVPHTLEILQINQSSKQYDGTDALPDGALVKYFESKVLNYNQQITLKEGTDYVVTEARFDTPDASNDAKGYRYTVELKNPNYVFADGTRVQTAVYGEIAHTAVRITKADAPAAESGALTVLNNHAASYTFDLSSLLPAAPVGEYGTVEYGRPTLTLSGIPHATTTLVNSKTGELTLEIAALDNTRTGEIGTITVPVTTTNYQDITLTVALSATNRIIPVGAPTLSGTTLVWGDLLNTITLSGTMRDEENGKDVPGTFAWDGTNIISGIGRFPMTWTFTPDDGDAYTMVGGFSEIEIVKATPTGEPKYTAITESGRTLADAALTAEGGSFSLPGTVQWVDETGTELDVSTAVEANTAYRWRFVPEDSEHYNELAGTITLYTVSDSGGSDDDDGGSGSGGSGGGSTGTTGSTGTVTNPDGSTTKTETKPDGTTVETTTRPDGSTTKTTTSKDGSSVTESKTADGSTGTVTVSRDGRTTGSAGISEKAVEDAKANGEAVKAPVEVKSEKDSNSAPTIDITLPAGSGETKVEIPVSNVSSGTVAIIVHPDGTEEIDKSGTVTETGVEISVSGSATVKIVDNSKDFTDTRSHWSKDDVNFVAARELFNGVGNNRFGVGESMTRGMVNTVLARLAGVDTTPESGSKWYEPGTAWAVSNGITDGTNLNGAVTREQLAAMLYRYAGSPEVSGSLGFDDAPSASGYAQDALLWATKMGVLNGVGGNRLSPKDGASREQVAAMLARYLKNA